jgi:hypothetical protein
MEYRVYREQNTTTTILTMYASHLHRSSCNKMIIIRYQDIIIYIRYQSNLEVLYDLYAVLLSIPAPPVQSDFRWPDHDPLGVSLTKQAMPWPRKATFLYGKLQRTDGSIRSPLQGLGLSL